MFWSTFCCQILIIFNFLESLGHKETECTSFAKKVLQIICIQPVKRDLHIFVFLNYTSGYLKCCKFVLYIWNGMVKGFSNILSFFWTFFLQGFSLNNRILQKKIIFSKFANLFADSKSRAQELSIDPPPPPAYPGFQVPQQG